MAANGRRIKQFRGLRKHRCLFRSNRDLETPAFPGVKNDGRRRLIRNRRRTAAVSVAMKTKLAWAELAPRERRRGGRYDEERRCFLPVHNGKIPVHPGLATEIFHGAASRKIRTGWL
jgi:hypothetical protein